MNDNAQRSLSLLEVTKLFSDWRQKRTVKGPIPEALWRAVALLETSQSIGAVAVALGLNHSQLKSKLKEYRGSDSSAAPAPFVKETRVATTNRPSSIQVTKVLAVQPTPSPSLGPIEVVSPGGWVLRSGAPIGESQIREFARAVSEAT